MMQLINNWREWHKFWSVRLQLAGAALLTIAEVFPDALISIWSSIPPDIRAEIPADTVRWIGIALTVIGTVARIVRQAKLHG